MSVTAEKNHSLHGAIFPDAMPGFGFSRQAEYAEDGIAETSMGSYQEGWFISYIDILTLLLTLFVILLAMSQPRSNDPVWPRIPAVQTMQTETKAVGSTPISEPVIETGKNPDMKSVAVEHGRQYQAEKKDLPGYVNSLLLPDAKPKTSTNSPEVAPQEAGMQAETMLTDEKSLKLVLASAPANAQNEPGTSPLVPDLREPFLLAGIGASKLFDMKPNAEKIFPLQSLRANELIARDEDGQKTKPDFIARSVSESISEQDRDAGGQENHHSWLAQIRDSAFGQKIEILEAKDHVDLVISDRILFEPGRADLRTAGLDVLGQLAAMIKNTGLNVSVEGHTDNVPIHNTEFDSNWELSTARATMVTRYFIENEIAPERIRAIGYADTHPRAQNDTVEGRAHNRRVSIVLHMPNMGAPINTESVEAGSILQKADRSVSAHIAEQDKIDL